VLPSFSPSTGGGFSAAGEPTKSAGGGGGRAISCALVAAMLASSCMLTYVGCGTSAKERLNHPHCARFLRTFGQVGRQRGRLLHRSLFGGGRRQHPDSLHPGHGLGGDVGAAGALQRRAPLRKKISESRLREQVGRELTVGSGGLLWNDLIEVVGLRGGIVLEAFSVGVTDVTGLTGWERLCSGAWNVYTVRGGL
jgi:hypothetical protein